MIERLLHEEDGQTLAEYGLLLSLITFVVVVALTLLGKKVKNTFEHAPNSFSS